MIHTVHKCYTLSTVSTHCPQMLHTVLTHCPQVIHTVHKCYRLSTSATHCPSRSQVSPAMRSCCYTLSHGQTNDSTLCYRFNPCQLTCCLTSIETMRFIRRGKGGGGGGGTSEQRALLPQRPKKLSATTTTTMLRRCVGPRQYEATYLCTSLIALSTGVWSRVTKTMSVEQLF